MTIQGPQLDGCPSLGRGYHLCLAMPSIQAASRRWGAPPCATLGNGGAESTPHQGVAFSGNHQSCMLLRPSCVSFCYALPCCFGTPRCPQQEQLTHLRGVLPESSRMLVMWQGICCECSKSGAHECTTSHPFDVPCQEVAMGQCPSNF